MEVNPIRSPFRSFYYCTELVDEVARYCSWTTLVTLYEVDSRFRRVVQSLVRSRCLHLLSNFFDWSGVQAFFELLEFTDAAIVGSFVRCVMGSDNFDFYREFNPVQLNISVPYNPDCSVSELGTLNYMRWYRFLSENGFRDALGTGIGEAPVHLQASTDKWTLFNKTPLNERRVSLIQSRTCSALSPVLQSCHSSNFFALTSTRIYCLYPRLFAAKVNLDMKARMPSLECAFDSFNCGLISFTRTDYWEVFRMGDCDEACPSVWRRTLGLPGVGIFRWGGPRGVTDGGRLVSPSDGFEEMDEIWKVHGECCNARCPCITLLTNLFETALGL